MPDLDIGRLVGYVELDTDGVAKGAQDAKDRVGELGKSGATLGKAAGIGIGLAVAAGLMGTIDNQAAGAKLTAQLGATAGESERLGRVAGNLYSGAYGESLEEVNEALRNVTQNVAGMADASEADLERVSGKVLNVATTFDQDLGGVTRAVGTMLRTGLAKDADEALDVLTRGFQSGVNVADDLLDTFSEYGTQFRKLGLDATDATGLLQQGLKGGARDADIVADALKELSIRAIDGSEATNRGFETIGLSGEEMGRKFAAGGASAREALDTTLDKLRAIEDPTARAAAAVDLFGTQSEDLGAALFALDLDKAAGEMGKVEGAAQRVGDVLGGTAAAQFTTLKRSAEQFATELAGGALPVLSELGGTVLDVVTPALSAVGDVVGGVAEAFGALPDGVQTTAVVLASLVAFRGPISDTFDAMRVGATKAYEATLWGAAQAIGAVEGFAASTDNLGTRAGAAARSGVGALAGVMGGPLGIGIAAVSIGIPLLTSLFADNEDAAKSTASANTSLAQAIQATGGAIDDTVRRAAAKDLQASGLLDFADSWKVATSDMVDAALGQGDAIDTVRAAVEDYIDGLERQRDAIEGDTAGAEANRAAIDGVIDAQRTRLGELEDAAGTTSDTITKEQELAGAVEGTGEAHDAAARAAEDQEEALDQLKDALDRYLGINISVAEAQLGLLDGLAAIGEQTANNGTTLDRNTQAGRDNEGAILDQISAMGDLAEATYRQTGSSDAAKDAFYRERDALRDKLYALGYNKQAVDTLIATYGNIPDEVWTDVHANTSPATFDLNAWIAVANTRTASVLVRATLPDLNGPGVSGSGRPGMAAGGILHHYATGGLYDPMLGRPLAPMAANKAAVVGANEWRVIGDRAIGDEFYLPDDDAPATLSYGAEWARRRGLALVDLTAFAAGGIHPAGPSSSAATLAAARALEVLIRIDGNVYGDAHLRRVIAQAGDELLARLDDALTDAGVHP